MLADFHSLGSLPSFREMLNILDKDGAIVDADSLSIRAVIPSGPQAFFIDNMIYQMLKFFKRMAFFIPR